jgi:hypothetical protein
MFIKFNSSQGDIVLNICKISSVVPEPDSKEIVLISYFDGSNVRTVKVKMSIEQFLQLTNPVVVNRAQKGR